MMYAIYFTVEILCIPRDQANFRVNIKKNHVLHHFYEKYNNH